MVQETDGGDARADERAVTAKLPRVYSVAYHQVDCGDPRCRGCHVRKRRQQFVKGQRATP